MYCASILFQLGTFCLLHLLNGYYSAKCLNLPQLRLNIRSLLDSLIQLDYHEVIVC